MAKENNNNKNVCSGAKDMEKFICSCVSVCTVHTKWLVYQKVMSRHTGQAYNDFESSEWKKCANMWSTLIVINFSHFILCCRRLCSCSIFRCPTPSRHFFPTHRVHILKYCRSHFSFLLTPLWNPSVQCVHFQEYLKKICEFPTHIYLKQSRSRVDDSKHTEPKRMELVWAQHSACILQWRCYIRRQRCIQQSLGYI